MNTYETVVTRRGQVTIPDDRRMSAGIREGDRVSFEQVANAIQIRRARGVLQRTSGKLVQYVPNLPLTVEVEREAFEMGVAEGAIESMNR